MMHTPLVLQGVLFLDLSGYFRSLRVWIFSSAFLLQATSYSLVNSHKKIIKEPKR